ncbi:hypothetical protein, variant 4 [Aphanomyces invadans]|uniref:Kinesin motor domain-containing protein n=1 Tax=Aphanomyces invadans TaxID=157072 RepID=A0A024U5Y4_9STRA|nr:hypothetical protein H310_06302 [Aphanomyces invadans]XP_008869530.1 hypothetical protein, variant 1 [Aphanomyces invadans]XP_008869531.1 hypothetical protein, variant 2 [Aphanomyces invadans]XP_008869532.1 hypothetical protein, variant 3 [Aphanomyces invadans]XP_008869533.1 hypothetical protein, variant 4 [Aphanomyces invadans]ETW01681.1 hypothetical protein H310_06302 [Aphanomyces invadans]ETW01682.1 hypothetical protein, variant 1 [Aphanomyces invadans]ETW01683.1 hypothetical protein, |eukprot:XP_008869529.1 hypothetical protein H310_06302 [Aphanomyces invadans]
MPMLGGHPHRQHRAKAPAYLRHIPVTGRRLPAVNLTATRTELDPAQPREIGVAVARTDAEVEAATVYANAVAVVAAAIETGAAVKLLTQAADGSFAFHAARESTMTADDCVQVCVRIRPTSKKEQAAIASNNCIRVMPSPKPPTQLVVGKDRPFTFDSIHTVDTTQEALYATSVTSLVNGFIEGYNATVLAYGQTGTGKTFTMTGGAAYSAKLQDSHGVIPRAVCHVFQLMHARQQVSECLLRIEYVEIYNEELRDLLHPETSSKNLSIREDADGHIVVTGAKSQAVQTPDDVMRLLSMGSAARVTGSTQMNEQSSRSHAIFTLVLQQKRRDSGQLTHAKFHLVDLAGSERAKRTGAVGGRFKESVNINQGLLALGNVISALGDDAKKKAHVPYRDSKLTRLLQDSLGGNSKTLMIACVSPVAANFDETLNTLKYANRAKNIKNRPVVNHVKEADTDDTILRMKEEIQMLQRQLVTTPPVAVAAPEEHDQQLLHEWTAKVQALQRAVQTAKSTAKEGATALVALERDIKALGRPVQQRLNDVVKLLNSIVLLQHDSPATPINGADDLPHNNAHEYRAEINALHDKLKQDVEIFELKSKEMEQLQRQMAQAHKELEALRAMNQQLQMATTVACATPRRRDVEGATNQSGDSMDRKAVSLFAKRHSVDDDDSVLMADPEMTTETTVTILHLQQEIVQLKTELAKSKATDGVLFTTTPPLTKPKESHIPPARAQTAKLPRSSPPPAVSALPVPPKTADPTAVPLDTTSIHAMFQTQLLAAVESHVKQAQVATMLRAKEVTAKEKEDIARRKHGLEMEKMRQSLSVQSSITDLAQSIHAMNSKLHATGSPDPEELSRLKRRKDRAEKKLALFVQKMESQSYVDPAVQDELSALEEQIEDLNSQILFQDSQLESAQAQVPESTAIDQVLKHVATSGAAIDPKLKTWIQMCWTELVDVSVQIKAVQATLQLQDEMVVQLTQNREQLENGLNAARAEYDRRLLQNELLQASDKKHMDELMVLLADKQNQIDALRATEKVSSSDAKTLADLNHLVTAKQNELDQLKKRLGDAEKDKKRLTEYDRYVSERQAEWEAKLAEVQRTLEVERVAAQASIDDLRQQLAQVQRVQAAPVASPSESELAPLKEKLQAQQEYVVNLEKHVLLFKNKAKQAQQQLQQLIRDSAGNQNNDEDNPRIKQLEDMNEALMKENAAMKVHLRAMKGPDPSDPHFRVRIPKAELIEVELPTPVPQSSEQQ